MRIWIAGRDKPHRCPNCWRCSWADSRIRTRTWRISKWLPRRCGRCHHLTISTFPDRAYGKRLTFRKASA